MSRYRKCGRHIQQAGAQECDVPQPNHAPSPAAVAAQPGFVMKEQADQRAGG
jgi:hypothetical protein